MIRHLLPWQQPVKAIIMLLAQAEFSTDDLKWDWNQRRKKKINNYYLKMDAHRITSFMFKTSLRCCHSKTVGKERVPSVSYVALHVFNAISSDVTDVTRCGILWIQPINCQQQWIIASQRLDVWSEPSLSTREMNGLWHNNKPKTTLYKYSSFMMKCACY